MALDPSNSSNLEQLALKGLIPQFRILIVSAVKIYKQCPQTASA